jgi:tetratricopeptide (TPR) repeat protein
MDPHDPDQSVWLAIGWTYAGHPQHARPLFERMLSTDPHFDYLLFGLGFDAYFSGEFARAVAFYEQARQLSPDHPGASMVLAQVFGSTGDLERMASEVDQHLPDPGSHPLATLTHIFKHALLGNADAVDTLATDEWADKIWSDFQYTHVMAQAQAALGRKTEALRWLERCTQRGLIHYPFLAERDPLLRNLRGDAAFAAILEGVRRQWVGFAAAVADRSA